MWRAYQQDNQRREVDLKYNIRQVSQRDFILIISNTILIPYRKPPDITKIKEAEISLPLQEEEEEMYQFRQRPLPTFEDEHLSQLSKECSLSDMLVYDDVDHDTHLNLNEFYASFSKLY
ncbi:hypothetical protein DAPPUDRAFT_272172, partial [Daphnia pulex]